jgi:hypothetical protein
MTTEYVPQLDDYVKWRNIEGWVYFVDSEYITIEIATKPKSDDLVPLHKKHHVLIVCHHWYWNDVKYIKNRRNEGKND